MRLILNDGTVIEDGGAGDAGKILWLYFPGYTMREAAKTAFNSRKTARIEHEYGEKTDVYEGYTKCTRLIDEGNKISIGMEKEVL